MNLKLELPEWSLSDDTIMHIATAKALISDWFSKKEFHVDLEVSFDHFNLIIAENLVS